MDIKKMSTALAVVGMAMGGFAVESSNVVGYSQSELRSGSSAVGAQFVPVSGGEMDLCDIIPTGYNKATYVGGSIYVQLLDYQGYMVPGSKYFWYKERLYPSLS